MQLKYSKSLDNGIHLIEVTNEDKSAIDIKGTETQLRSLLKSTTIKFDTLATGLIKTRALFFVRAESQAEVENFIQEFSSANLTRGQSEPIVEGYITPRFNAF